MKKTTTEQDEIRLRLAEKKIKRRRRKDHLKKRSSRKPNSPSNGKKNRNLTDLPLVKAPPAIDIYNVRNHEKTVKFLTDLRRTVSAKQKVRICFRDTHAITAAAGLLFIAELDRLTKHYPNAKYESTPPRKQVDKKFGNETFVVESALNRIGFYKLIGKQERNLPEYPNVKCWNHAQGLIADGSIAGELLSQLGDTLSSTAKKRLYRGAIEAISNCVDHAYPTQRPDKLNISDNRWWMFVGIYMNRLAIIVCDLGVGIPVTLPQKHSSSVLNKVMEFLKIRGTNDSELIQAATYLSQTRTGEKYRGKGGKDIRSLITHYDNAKLVIYSNKGCYIDRNFPNGAQKRNAEMLSERRHSILGTIIEWTVPLEELAA